ncbi:CLIP domain-containing serine protease 14D-like isoform X2 [Drosophila eugracilis]|uniref:CLIP domain-containing serine protease 14D-like isoform X2 n=1 Tax=Drosophila eugracilis TaxID=29029 RepID=UPI001BDA1B16|nr:CLIP domain-containing serine protease 14D-like isoform X2 [Drosophila eugracilis]
MEFTWNALLTTLACSGIVGSLGTSNYLEQPCGIVPVHKFKIVGGHTAPRASTPWMASLIGENGFICGATLITNRSRRVRLGENDLSKGGQEFKVDARIKHHNYSGDRHDIALLRLSARAQYTERISPICLLLDPLFSHLEDHIIKFRTYGWGENQFGRLNTILHKTSLYNTDRVNCSREFQNRSIDRDHICAKAANSSTCNGDSGGPLTAIVTYDHVATEFQFGIVSFGKQDCGGVTVFTNVMSHLEWIVENVRKAEKI